MAKIIKGNSFGRCVRYVTSKEGAQLIAANGVLLDNVRSITDSFNDQAKMNPRLGKIVGHISLNFSGQDKNKVDNAFMFKVAKEYMQKMGIADTQFIVVRHNDREHPHCHIVFNRVSNSGKTISDKNDQIRNVKVCKALTEKHGLYLKTTDAKQNVKRERLRGPDKIKYEIYDAIKAALLHCTNWSELQKRLAKNGIVLTFKYKGNTDERQGVIFSKNGQSFNGSKVDRQFSYSKLDAAMNENAYKQSSQVQTSRNIIKPQAPEVRSNVQQHSGQQQNNSGATSLGRLFDIQPGPVYDEQEAEFRRQQRKKKKKTKGRSL